MSPTQPGSTTPLPSASLEERITETERVEKQGVRDGGKRRLKGKHRAFSFLHPPLLVSGCQAATMLSWPFFQSVGNSVGSPHRAGGNDFFKKRVLVSGER